MRIEHSDQDEIDEEALHPVLAPREVFVFEVGADDAQVVGSIPVPGGWASDEREYGVHAG